MICWRISGTSAKVQLAIMAIGPITLLTKVSKGYNKYKELRHLERGP